jgi:ATP-dependent Lhr-like helicase
MLASLEVVIVDEIHALVATKRGAHLALSLERLDQAASRTLSASASRRRSVRSKPVARYLGGGTPAKTRWTPRPVVDRRRGDQKAFDIKVEVPVEDMARLGEPMLPLPIGNAKGPAGRAALRARDGLDDDALGSAAARPDPGGSPRAGCSGARSGRPSIRGCSS